MIKRIFIIIVLLVPLLSNINAQPADSFSDYLKSYDYQERKDMKIKLSELLELLESGDNVEIIDIRFKEEYEAWNVNFIKSIPLNQLPDRINEIDKSKLIVTVCPHYDRAAIARHYLKLKGYNAKYLTDGLLGLVDYLRGDRAKIFIDKLKIKNGKKR